MRLNEIKKLLNESTYDTTVEIRGRKYNVRVFYTDFPASRGARDSLGVPEEPDEEAGIEIEGVHILINGKQGKDISKHLTQHQFDEITSNISDDLGADEYDDDPRGDAGYPGDDYDDGHDMPQYYDGTGRY